ncbi:MAG TPA: hypothetical protein VGR37_21370 [Longimicrobiaceae bacterium]|nr:hypothetical protein [Longimicrobiaceae bacterium]
MYVVLGLQSAMAFATVAFAVAALLAARQTGGRSFHTVAWLVTGVAFLLEGISSTLQSSGAIWAVVEGPGSAVYEAYLRWSTVGNLGRSFLKIGLGFALLLLPLGGRFSARRQTAIAVAWFFLFLALGSILGLRDGPVQARHFSLVAVLDTVEMIVTWAALFGAISWNSIDRLLWVALALNGVRQALNVIWTSALAWVDMPGAWAPSPALMQFYACVTLAIMTGLAVWRLRLTRRGVNVPGLLEPSAQAAPSLLG